MLRRNAFAVGPLAASSLWGGMYVVSKWGFSVIPPVTLAFLRVFLGALALVVVVRLYTPERSFSRSDKRGFVFLGAWVTLTLVTQFIGTDLTNASQGSLLTVLTPVFTLLLGVAVLNEVLTLRKTMGMALAAVGTLVVLSGQYDLTRIATPNILGVSTLLVASFAWAGYTVWGKSLVRKYSALETATYSTVAATPMLGVLVPLELAFTETSFSLSLPLIGAILYLGLLSTAAAWYLWYKGLEYVDAGTVAVFFFAQPLVGTTLGALFLGEELGTLFLIGGAVMAIGVYVVSVSRETDERIEKADKNF